MGAKEGQKRSTRGANGSKRRAKEEQNICKRGA